MDDRRLSNLVRMAAEIEEIERAAQLIKQAGATPLRLAGSQADSPVTVRTARRLPWAVRLSPFAAAAACVVVAVMIGRSPIGSNSGPNPSGGDAGTRTVVQGSSVNPHGAAGDPLELKALASSGSSERNSVRSAAMTSEQFRAFMRKFEPPSELGSGVLAIYQDDAGVVRCVTWHPQALDSRPIEKLEPGELVKATYGQHCSIVGPHRLIAVAVRGPKENLPSSTERAQELAQCIVGDALMACQTEQPTLSVASAACVPNDLHIMMETLAMGRP